jgi:hypothetical protein
MVSQDAESFIQKLYESSSDTADREFERFILKNSDIRTEQQILDFLIKNKKNNIHKIRALTRHFLYEMSDKSKDLKIRQESLYHFIDMHFLYAGFGHVCYPKEIFTDKTIELIVSILNREMTEEEYALNFERRDTTKKFDDEIIKQKRKELHCSKQVAIDSLFKELKRKSIESFYRHEENTDKFIRLFGWLGKKEYAPMLENLLNDRRYKKKTIFMVLAKLGYKDYFEKTFATYPDDFKIPNYINTREAWWKFIQVNNKLDIVVKRDMFGEKLTSTNLSWAIDFTSQFLHIHFPDDPYFYGFAEKEEDIPELIEKTKKAYKWIEENKENLRMKDRKEFCF